MPSCVLLWAAGICPLNLLLVPRVPSDVLESLGREIDITLLAGPFWTQINNLDNDILLSHTSSSLQPFDLEAAPTCLALATFDSSLLPVSLVQGSVVDLPPLGQLLRIKLTGVLSSGIDAVRLAVGRSIASVGGSCHGNPGDEAHQCHDKTNDRHVLILLIYM